MSTPRPRPEARPEAPDLAAAQVFSALGDPTRLALLSRLAAAEPRSIARLTAGAGMSRQAISKHLRVLEGAGMVRKVRIGRESRFELEPRTLADVRGYLDRVSAQWDEAIARLRALVEPA